MPTQTICALLIPFVGTCAGAALAFTMKKAIPDKAARALDGFSAGVMLAVSVWCLIIPAIEGRADLGALAFLPASAGLWLGILFMAALEAALPEIHAAGKSPARLIIIMTAMTLHNLPEGMAVGVTLAALGEGAAAVTLGGATALSLGIALHNIPEGAIVSLPLRAEGKSRLRAFTGGVLSGVIEPVGSIFALSAPGLVVPLLPYLLSFAAGTMIYVAVCELIPGMSRGGRSPAGAIAFTVGFTLMMAIDIALE